VQLVQVWEQSLVKQSLVVMLALQLVGRLVVAPV
jgi:hypothetical protein